MNSSFKSLFSGINDFLLVAGMIGILMVLFTPISSATLDFLLVINFSFALLILLITFYTEKPLEFSTFPSLLLMTTLFRLALNIAATRLILNDADAGKVIGSVGEHVVGGNYVIGLVVFLILIVVQYVVITNGAQRVAEVAARFILDSMPGKQMSIDADLNMGLIDQDEAKMRRAQLEKEANFYGAMDGASKFVKGDAIAGIIIILIDIIGGLSIGIVQNGMPWGQALHQYTLLTVGDGIVTQIPSLIIAVATGIIITRAATDTRLAQEITSQFSAHPKTLIIVACTLGIFMLLPGIPVFPVAIVACALLGMSWLIFRNNKAEALTNKKTNDSLDSDPLDVEFKSLMQIAPYELVVSKNIAKEYFTVTQDMENRIGLLRKQIASKFGVIVPALTINTDNKLKDGQYRICIHGIDMGKGVIRPDKLLAINGGAAKIKIDGEETVEPTYGLAAQWIMREQKTIAHSAGYTLVEPEIVLSTHIQEITKANLDKFLSRNDVENLVESKREDIGSTIDELIPAILSYSDIQNVLKALVVERVPVKNLGLILEILVDHGRHNKDIQILTEKVRTGLSTHICNMLADSNGKLNMITLAPRLERKFLSGQANSSTGDLLPQELEQFIAKVAKEYEKLLSQNIQPVLLCAAPIRKSVRDLLARAVPQISVMSINEVSQQIEVQAASVIDLDLQLQGKPA
ncbi:flagellar biosynthesis protein FlhA [Catenovulum sediminis]|uniref:flagellar biosynthesis protein FlhA n=1 Tax=Catenovulum sediminis TaxID=1740262 RepID=UPI00117FFA6F|nr:flagellar biosynthesis protein FlhA [Catenovulum sediminis]